MQISSRHSKCIAGVLLVDGLKVGKARSEGLFKASAGGSGRNGRKLLGTLLPCYEKRCNTRQLRPPTPAADARRHPHRFR